MFDSCGRASFPVLVLTGPRQVGKTSLAERTFPGHAYVTLDLGANAEMAETRPEEFLNHYPPPVIYDEVQYAPGLFRHIKARVDKRRREAGRFILTGSQSFPLMQQVSDSLAGRRVIRKPRDSPMATVARLATALGRPVVLARSKRQRSRPVDRAPRPADRD